MKIPKKISITVKMNYSGVSVGFFPKIGKIIIHLRKKIKNHCS